MTLRGFLGLMLALAGGALWAQDAPDANGGKKRIVVLGDSITAGYGLDPQEAYPALLQKKIDSAGLPYTVVNAGVSGDTTAGGLRRVSWALGKGADVLVVALGGNDGLRGISPEQTEKNLSGIIDKAREKNPAIKVVVAGMQMPDNMGAEFTEKFKGLFAKVATEKKAALVPFLLEGVGGSEELNQQDRIHPTEKGQEKVAESVWKVLKGEL
ncbi:arylesterase [Luteolibacter arcticus]|uniref:Arylesterase n=1 Tax=Luteolibacter arcticus TaxID=1581411 RepID=A0ABT3GKJ3_9BACT|nr:arylesterase [Luteolibacter arcticus]MCW1924013.1 arylesterase [Luteolibacter arcticus]